MSSGAGDGMRKQFHTWISTTERISEWGFTQPYCFSDAMATWKACRWLESSSGFVRNIKLWIWTTLMSKLVVLRWHWIFFQEKYRRRKLFYVCRLSYYVAFSVVKNVSMFVMKRWLECFDIGKTVGVERVTTWSYVCLRLKALWGVLSIREERQSFDTHLHGG